MLLQVRARILVEKAHLPLPLWQLPQVAEAVLRGGEDAVFPAGLVKEPQQRIAIRTRQLVGVSVLADIPALEPREMPIQGRVEVFPAPLPKRQAHAEADDPLYPDADALVQDRPEVFLRVVQIGQDRAEPDNGGDPPLSHLLQHLDPPFGIAHIWLQDLAEGVVVGSERHLHHAFGRAVDIIQQINVPQDPVGFGQNGGAKAVAQDDLQAFPGQTQLLLAGQIGVGHGTRADHASLPLGPQRPLQQLRRVLLHLDVLKGVAEPIAAAPAVAVDAAVDAAAINVHSGRTAAPGQDSLRIHKMHGVIPSFRCKTRAAKKSPPSQPAALAVLTSLLTDKAILLRPIAVFFSICGRR